MKEYCDHCAQKYGTKNHFIGLSHYGKTAHVICAGCGLTHVNHLGECQKCKNKKIFRPSTLFFLFLLSIVITFAIMSIKFH